MGRQDQIINERKRKLKELRDSGVNPYPYTFDQKDLSEDVKEKFKKLKNDERTKIKVQVAGRVMTVRNLGKLIFATIQDSKGSIQIILQKGETTDASFSIFKKYVDTGDFVGCSGIVMKSRTGEVSILIKKSEILSKAILPLPEKWHGLKDKEDRYRRRYLDLIMNPEVKEVFVKRAKIIGFIREFLNNRDFIEASTPALQPLYGGTNAKPFKTHLNVLDMDVYLRLAPELYLKRLVVGGFHKVYDICTNFRNEGMDFMHNPEFTMIEWYEAYTDYNGVMDTAEELYKYIAKSLNGSYSLEFQKRKINLN